MSYPCSQMFLWPPAISADGKTFTYTDGKSFLTAPLAAGNEGTGSARVDLTTKPQEFVITPLWASASGGTIIAEWGDVGTGWSDTGTVQSGPTSKGVQIDVISGGKATQLHVPAGLIPLSGGDIAW